METGLLDDVHRRDLLELLGDRHGTRSNIVTSQHYDASLADAILDEGRLYA